MQFYYDIETNRLYKFLEDLLSPLWVRSGAQSISPARLHPADALCKILDLSKKMDNFIANIVSRDIWLLLVPSAAAKLKG